MSKNSIILISLFSVFLLTSCGKDFDLGGFFGANETVGERFRVSQKFNDANPIDTIFVPDDYQFFVGGDVHISDNPQNLVSFNNAIEQDPNVNFGIIVGDLVNGKGFFSTIETVIGDNPSIKRNIRFAAGNHDIYHRNYKDFTALFGTLTYFFIAKSINSNFTDLFIVVDTANATLGKSQMSWLEKLFIEQSDKNHRRIFVFSHTHFFQKADQVDIVSRFNEDERVKLMAILSSNKVNASFQGHIHSYDVRELGGVQYIQAGYMRPYDNMTYVSFNPQELTNVLIKSN